MGSAPDLPTRLSCARDRMLGKLLGRLPQSHKFELDADFPSRLYWRACVLFDPLTKCL